MTDKRSQIARLTAEIKRLRAVLLDIARDDKSSAIELRYIAQANIGDGGL